MDCPTAAPLGSVEECTAGPANVICDGKREREREREGEGGRKTQSKIRLFFLKSPNIIIIMPHLQSNVYSLF